MLKVVITGHRPARLGSYDPSNPTRVWIRSTISDVLDTLKPNYAYTGMALGVDQDFAAICDKKGIPFEAVIPFRHQESKWPQASQFVYWDLIKKARKQHIVCEPGYAAWKLQRRNEWMIDALGPDDIVIAVWDGVPSGTANCVRYAQQSGNRIVKINPKTEKVTFDSRISVST